MTSSLHHHCPNHVHQHRMEKDGKMSPDYESLPPGTPTWVNCTAGAIAGIAEHCLVYPLDFLKTRLMIPHNVSTGCSSCRSLRSVMNDAVKNEGMLKPIRGVGLVMVTSGPAHALYFGAYELVKRRLNEYGSFGYVTGAICATLLHDAVMVPSDTIKQRIHVSFGQQLTATSCFTNIIRNEGVKSLYRSYMTHLTMTIPFQITHFFTYETFQNTFNRDRECRPLMHIAGGGIAGATAAAITNPLDVCKTLINTQHPMKNGAIATNLRQAVCLILKTEGPSMLFKGIYARMAFTAPSTAISWSVYELFKNLLFKEITVNQQP